MNQIKLYFLTGFLGSGKTTLLKNLLETILSFYDLVFLYFP